MGRIVVGIDGSEGSQRALDWALDEARVRGATVEAVHAWQVPYVAGFPYTASAYDPAAYERAATEVLDRAIEGADTSALVVPVERHVVMGYPSQAVFDAAKGADLVVVGSRGLGGFRSALLGSVSHHLVHHAPCPVVVIPPTE